MTGRKMTDRKMTDRKMTGRKRTGRKRTGRKMTDRKMTDRKMTGRKRTGRKRTGRKMTDRKAGANYVETPEIDFDVLLEGEGWTGSETPYEGSETPYEGLDDIEDLEDLEDLDSEYSPDMVAPMSPLPPLPPSLSMPLAPMSPLPEMSLLPEISPLPPLPPPHHPSGVRRTSTITEDKALYMETAAALAAARISDDISDKELIPGLIKAARRAARLYSDKGLSRREARAVRARERESRGANMEGKTQEVPKKRKTKGTTKPKADKRVRRYKNGSLMSEWSEADALKSWEQLSADLKRARKDIRRGAVSEEEDLQLKSDRQRIISARARWRTIAAADEESNDMSVYNGQSINEIEDALTTQRAVEAAARGQPTDEDLERIKELVISLKQASDYLRNGRERQRKKQGPNKQEPNKQDPIDEGGSSPHRLHTGISLEEASREDGV